MQGRFFCFLLLLIALLVSSCRQESTYEYIDSESIPRYQEGEELSVGKFTNIVVDQTAYIRSVQQVTRKQKLQILRGKHLFTTNWVPAPASTTGLDGLGPLFNAKACVECHPKNGRAVTLTSSTDDKSGFLMRISMSGTTASGAPLPVPNYGTQLQTHGVLRVPKEGIVTVTYQQINGQYDDGIKYQLRKPIYTIKALKYGNMPTNVLFSPRIGNQLIGLGFIDGLTDTEILKNADPYDRDNDGISGRPNYVWDRLEHRQVMGRFGWKANEPNLKQQIAGAFHQDIGLSSPIFPNQNCSDYLYDCEKFPNGNSGGFEVSDQGIEDVTMFESSITVPARRNVEDKNVLLGKALFTELRCISCHKTGFLVTNSRRFPNFNGTVINPYSDFLLHDMGSGLADNRLDFKATGSEWRTPMLWGIGLQQQVNGHKFYLHDGRARSIEEAILWHGGEAENSKLKFKNLNKLQRSMLLFFVNSL